MVQPRPRIVELPFRFRPRVHGESKLDNRVVYDFFLFFIEKKISRFLPLPARLISFALINGFGIVIHLAVLMLAVSVAGLGFTLAQFIATVVSMAFNYSVNNAVTYHDRQLKGIDFYVGFVIFAVLCSVGIVGNISVATLLHEHYRDIVYLAPALAGAFIAVVWNYVATRAFVWGRGAMPKFRRARVGRPEVDHAQPIKQGAVGEASRN